jgi:hypothetical protein
MVVNNSKYLKSNSNPRMNPIHEAKYMVPLDVAGPPPVGLVSNPVLILCTINVTTANPHVTLFRLAKVMTLPTMLGEGMFPSRYIIPTAIVTRI